MIIQCPECELQVSDKAIACPHCGYPLKAESNKESVKKSRRNATRRRRLPNGFGRITEIKNRNLRKPFRAMVTVGKTSTGKPIGKPLKPEAYFATYNEAYAALVEYNKNPYDLEAGITVKELYDRWYEEYMANKTENYAKTIRTSWRYCSSLYNMRFKDLRARHIKGCMEDGTMEYKGTIHHTTPTIKSRIKSIFNLMGDYALEYELVDRNYARTFNLDSSILDELTDNRKEHIAYTAQEMHTLWQNSDIPCVDVILVQCYSGWRPQELGLIKMENVDLKNWFFKGGMKTSAGEGRVVPIHPKIRPLVQRAYDEAKCIGSEYLFNATYADNKKRPRLTYDKFEKRYVKIRDALRLNPEHKPHDGRKHFVTQAKKYKVDDYAIKYMVGHAINDITEAIYTERENSWLQEEIAKIK